MPTTVLTCLNDKAQSHIAKEQLRNGRFIILQCTPIEEARRILDEENFVPDIIFVDRFFDESDMMTEIKKLSELASEMGTQFVGILVNESGDDYEGIFKIGDTIVDEMPLSAHSTGGKIPCFDFEAMVEYFELGMYKATS